MGRRILSSVWLMMLIIASVAFSQDELYVEQLYSTDAFKTSVVRGAVALKANMLAVLSSEKTLRLYEIPSLKEKSSPIDLPSTINDLSFSASGTMLALGAADGQVHLFDLQTGAISRSLAIHSQRINAIVFQDEGWIFSAGIERTIAITDAIGATAIGSVSTQEEITTLAIQPDAINCAAGLTQGQIDIIAIGTLSTIATLNDAKDKISALCYSADGKFLAAGTVSGELLLWDAQSGVLQKKYEQKGSILSVAFDPKTRWMVSTSTDGIIKFYDLVLLSDIKTVAEHDGYVAYAAFLNDETLLTGTSTGQLKCWRVAVAPPDTTNPGIVMEQPVSGMVTGKAFAREYELRGLVYDDVDLKEVTVNSVPVALKAISTGDTAQIPAGMKAIKRFITIFKLDSVGSNPFEIKVSDKANHSVNFSGEIQRLSKNQAVEIISPFNNSEVVEVSLPLKFHAWFDVATYSISNNMIDIVNEQVPNLKAAGDEISENVSLFLGYNQIQLSVTSKSGDKYSKTLSLNRVLSSSPGAPPPISSGVKKDRPTSGPQSWAVIVGVSAYKNPGIPSLKYADKDAEALAEFLRRPEGGGYDSDHMRVLLNQDATLANVKDALINFLNQAIDMDLVFIYFAGHGAPEPARPQNIYLLTQDSDPNALGTTAFPMWDIQTVLARYINAKRVIVFSDACHSGNISVNFATRGVGVTEQNLVNQYLTDLSKSKQGVVVFTASASGEVSQEFPEMNHGVFTYYLLEGLEGKADYNNDYTVTINELMQYVEEQVKRKTRGAQNPTRSQTDYDKEMTISLIPH